MKYVNFCLAVLASFILMSGSATQSISSTGYHLGETIPDIVFEDMEGNLINLGDLKGEKVVLNFWAAYDAPSRAVNVQLYNQLKEQDADVKFVSVAFDENKNVVEKTLLLDQMDTYAYVCKAAGTESEFYKNFLTNKGSRNYLIDETGVIKAIDLTPEKLISLL